MNSPKVSFACKIIKIEDVVRCSFDINKTQYDILMLLSRSKEPLTISEIASKLGKDRTTVQKAVKVLYDKQLITRRQMNLDNGGYTYYYLMKDKENSKKQIIKLIDEWAEEAKRTILHWN